MVISIRAPPRAAARTRLPACRGFLLLLLLLQRLRTLEALGPLVARRRVLGAGAAAVAAPAGAARAATQLDDLKFLDGGDGILYADVAAGRGDATVAADSRVTVELVGRLVGRQGWTFENTRDDDEPYRLSLGKGEVIAGLERGLQGMRVGAVRRIILPSAQAYRDRAQQPVPRTFAFQQRLYSTVLNENRKVREATSELGADLAGKVMFDVKVLAIRPPAT